MENISVVIPTLNESETIRGALECLREEKNVLEILVVDAGSSDGTQDLVPGLGGRLIEGTRGRGLQINKGIQQCTGDVVLILHADCQIRPGVLERMLSELNSPAHYVGGAMGMRYQSSSLRNRFLAFLNNSRARWTGMSFGDQGQFFRKEALPLMGGYPEQMLMEDVELSMRMKESGFVCYIPDGVVVSGRRWEKLGFWKNGTKVIRLCLSYLVRRRVGLGDGKGELFYERYYMEA